MPDQEHTLDALDRHLEEANAKAKSLPKEPSVSRDSASGNLNARIKTVEKNLAAAEARRAAILDKGMALRASKPDLEPAVQGQVDEMVRQHKLARRSIDFFQDQLDVLKKKKSTSEDVPVRPGSFINGYDPFTEN